jgi:peroxiredoxin
MVPQTRNSDGFFCQCCYIFNHCSRLSTATFMKLENLPDNLPVPEDDGAADHLQSTNLPDLALPATDGTNVNFSDLPGTTVFYIYPMTGRPGTPLPDNWDSIPGARGCTPQSCSFRDHYQELQALNTGVFGVSTQTTEYQREAKERLHLPFELLSDSRLQLKLELQLPSFSVDGMELYRRMALIVRANTVVKVFYPVFPPSENAADVLSWLRDNPPT